VAVTTADDLERQGYFKDAGAKFGVVYSDHPWWRTAASAFEQRAARYGVKVSAEVAICRTPCSTQEQTNESQNGIVRLRGSGVDHVVMLIDATSGGATWLASSAAAAYYPRLGMNSTNLPEVLALIEPSAAFRGAVGAGFMPATDVDAAQDAPQNQAMQLCSKIMSNAGQPTPTRLALEQERYTCDGFLFLKAAVDRAGGRTDPTVLRSAIDSLGDGFLPAMTWSDHYGPGRQDGTETFRPFEWTAACKCFTYVGGEVRMTPLPGQPR
jgi:ABC-type branched-subunit amino acid transport system substrate-binding protein